MEICCYVWSCIHFLGIRSVLFTHGILMCILPGVKKERDERMPTSKIESFYFNLMMCFGMVMIMTLNNLFINGLIGVMSFMEIFIQFIIVFVIAFVLLLFLIRPISKIVTAKLPYDKSNRKRVMLVNSTCIVVGMVFCMSFYGLLTAYLNNNLSANSIMISYFVIFTKNFIVAYPLLLFVIGPVVRYLFQKFVKKQEKVVEVA